MLFGLRMPKKGSFVNSAKSGGVLFLALTVVFISSFAQQATAQQDKTVVEQMLKKPTDKTKKSSLVIPPKNKTTKKKTTTPPPAKPSSPLKNALPRRTRTPRATTPKVEERQQVVFVTGATGVEILLNGKSVGFSDKSSKLAAWIPNGEHELTARKYEQNLFAAEKININAENKNIDIAAKVAKGVDELKLTGQSNNQPPAETKTLDVVALLEAYRDPLRTNTVTAKDWQTMYEESQRKLMFGSTDNVVEGRYTFAQAQVEMSLGNKVKALNLFEAAANIYLPDSAMMHYGLGAARLANNLIPDAGSAFVKAIQLDPNYALAYKGLGDVYLAQNRAKEAATQYQQAQKLGMTTPDLRLKLAEVQIRNKNCEGALKELEVLRTEAPSADVMLLLSECYLEEKRAVSAIEALGKGLELDPNSAVIHHRLGTIYLKQKEYGKAKESLERALALDSDNKLNRKELREMIAKAQKNAR